MASFKSGRLRIAVTYLDSKQAYIANVCPADKSEGPCEKIKINEPASGSRSAHGRRLAVDDPRAYRNTAHAAISFASDDLQSLAAHNRRGTGYVIKPATKRRK